VSRTGAGVVAQPPGGLGVSASSNADLPFSGVCVFGGRGSESSSSVEGGSGRSGKSLGGVVCKIGLQNDSRGGVDEKEGVGITRGFSSADGGWEHSSSMVSLM